MKVEFFIGPEQVALDGVDLCFSVGRYFKINLFKMNDTVFWFDELSIEISFGHNSEKNVDTKIGKFSSKLNFIIAVSTFFAVKGGDDHLSEEGYFGHEDGGLTIFLAICA